MPVLSTDLLKVSRLCKEGDGPSSVSPTPPHSTWDCQPGNDPHTPPAHPARQRPPHPSCTPSPATTPTPLLHTQPGNDPHTPPAHPARQQSSHPSCTPSPATTPTPLLHTQPGNDPHTPPAHPARQRPSHPSCTPSPATTPTPLLHTQPGNDPHTPPAHPLKPLQALHALSTLPLALKAAGQSPAQGYCHLLHGPSCTPPQGLLGPLPFSREQSSVVTRAPPQDPITPSTTPPTGHNSP
ncbi:uncharacterized protein [Saccopteryx leptura]|uniref:uncharacterized protein n=1 Tax=Saccopteryx leptura TaxID=249018 RepID=UPI00339CFCB6